VEGRDGLKPSVDIAYALVKQKDGRYRLRVTAEDAAPIIIGDFPSKQQAQAWIASRVRAPDQPAPEESDRSRKWRARAKEARTMAESMTSEAARSRLLQIAHGYEALAESLENAAQRHAKGKQKAG
jgi:hypothetical protein